MKPMTAYGLITVAALAVIFWLTLAEMSVPGLLAAAAGLSAGMFLRCRVRAGG